MEFFKTSTLDLAAFLLSKGAVFVDVTAESPRKCVFLFQNKIACEELSREFTNNGQVPAREILLRKKELVEKLGAKLNENKYRKPIL